MAEEDCQRHRAEGGGRGLGLLQEQELLARALQELWPRAGRAELLPLCCS